MRKIVCQMMTSLNGRIDDPLAWMTELSEDQYADIDAAYATYDTVIVGRVTYEEMAAYWPTVLTGSATSRTNKSMAGRMNRYRKIVVTRSDGFPPGWTNAEACVAKSDPDLVSLAAGLKSGHGADIHLAGGARLAQTFARLDLIDDFRLYLVPTISVGRMLFADVQGRRNLSLTHTTAFQNGVTLLCYSKDGKPAGTPASFDDLIVPREVPK